MNLSVKDRLPNQNSIFFDLGVRRSLLGMLNSKLVQGSSEYGRAFEHLVILEFIRLNYYFRKDFRFSFFRTSDRFEIDLNVERPGKKRALVEIKSASTPDPTEVSKLAAIVPMIKNAEAFILCQAKTSSEVQGVKIMPWRQGIDEIIGE